MRNLLTISNPFGGKVWHVSQTTSTMEEALQLEREFRASPDLLGSLVITDFQSAGRGRFANREWKGEIGKSLLFTIILQPLSKFPLSLSLGLGVCLFLEDIGLKPMVKWPNDILLNDAKLCGILVCGTTRLMHCGIGLNLGEQAFSPQLGMRQAVSLSSHGIEFTPVEALAKLLPKLYQAIQLDSENQRIEIEKRLWNLNNEIDLKTGGLNTEPIHGFVRGLADDGALLLENKAGLHKIYSGE